MKFRIALIVILVFRMSQAFSNSFQWEVKFQGIGDNREFFSQYSEAETIFGTRVKLLAGLNSDKIHQFNIGANYFYEFGSEPFDLKPDLLLNYTLILEDLTFKMGAFEKTTMQSYPVALFSRLDHYYKPNMEGIFINWDKSWGGTSIWVDWRGRKSETTREEFVVGHSLNLSATNFILDEYVYIAHRARRTFWEEGVFLENNLGAILLFGYRFSSMLPINKLEVRSGLFLSMYRHRAGVAFVPAYSSYSSLIIEQGRFGLEATYKFGDRHELFYGDKYFTSATNYFRADAYLIPFKLDNLYSKFTWSVHVANGNLEHQQLFSIIYQFGSNE